MAFSLENPNNLPLHQLQTLCCQELEAVQFISSED